MARFNAAIIVIKFAHVYDLKDVDGRDGSGSRQRNFPNNSAIADFRWVDITVLKAFSSFGTITDAYRCWPGCIH